MEKAALIKCLFVAAALSVFAGCVVRERAVTAVRPAPPGGEAIVTRPIAAPPPEIEMVPPRTDVTFVWVPGAWNWRARQWIWIPGRWTPPPRLGAVWVRGHWERRGRAYVWRDGHWR